MEGTDVEEDLSGRRQAEGDGEDRQSYEQWSIKCQGYQTPAHQLTLQRAELKTLRVANEALSKSRKAKKTRIRDQGTLIVSKAIDSIELKEVEAQL